MTFMDLGWISGGSQASFGCGKRLTRIRGASYLWTGPEPDRPWPKYIERTVA